MNEDQTGTILIRSTVGDQQATLLWPYFVFAKRLLSFCVLVPWQRWRSGWRTSRWLFRWRKLATGRRLTCCPATWQTTVSCNASMQLGFKHLAGFVVKKRQDLISAEKSSPAQIPVTSWMWVIWHCLCYSVPSAPGSLSSSNNLLTFPECPEDASVEAESEDDMTASHTSLDRPAPHRGNTMVHVCWHRNTSVSMVDFSIAVEVSAKPQPPPPPLLLLLSCFLCAASEFTLISQLEQCPPAMHCTLTTPYLNQYTQAACKSFALNFCHCKY